MKPIPNFLSKILIKISFFYLGGFCFFLGVLGVIFPLIPGIPFLFLSAFCFSKSSKFLSRLIRSSPYIGKHLAAWEDHGILPVKAKVFSIICLGGFLAYPVLLSEWLLWVRISLGVLFLVGTIFVLTRPSDYEFI